LILQRNFFPFWLRHQTSSIYGAPPFTGNLLFELRQDKRTNSHFHKYDVLQLKI